MVNISQKDIEELIALRNKVLLDKTITDKERERLTEQYHILALKVHGAMQRYRLIEYRTFEFFLSGRPGADEEYFRTSLGYPKLDLMKLLDDYITGKENGLIYTHHSATNRRSFLTIFIEWLNAKGVHPNDLDAEIFFQFIKERHIKPQAPVANIKAFWKWLRREHGVIYQDSLKDISFRAEEGLYPYWRVFITSREGEIPPRQQAIRDWNLELCGWEQLEKNWLFSEVNCIYQTIYNNANKFDDWKRLEIAIRLMRESGLRFEHARELRWSDISYAKKGEAFIYYEDLKHIQVGNKRLPREATPISPLLRNRIVEYRKTGGPKDEPEQSHIFQFKLTTGYALNPSDDYKNFTSISAFSKIMRRIMRLGEWQYCVAPISQGDRVLIAGEWYSVIGQDHPKTITIETGPNRERKVTYAEIRDLKKRKTGRGATKTEEEDEALADEEGVDRVGGLYLPTQSVLPLCTKMFRHSYATLIGNVLMDMGEIKDFTGDKLSTLEKHYVAPGLRLYYKRIGLKSYNDILKNVFSNEGLRDEDRPFGKEKPGPKEPIFRSVRDRFFKEPKLWK